MPKYLINLALAVCILALLLIGFLVGWWTAPKTGADLIRTPVADAVTIGWHPDESDVIDEWRDGELVRVYRPGDGNRYEDLQRILWAR